MPEIRTTECSEVGHPELVARFTDPAHEPYVRRWVDLLIERVWDGRKLEPGELLLTYGWLVDLIPEGDAFVLHADDLAAEAPTFKPGLDTALPWVSKQRDVAQSYDLTTDWLNARLATVEVCPETHDAPSKAWELVRSTSEAIAGESFVAAAGYGTVHPSGS